MKCLWCGTVITEAHATRMISHLVRQLNKNIKPCKGKIDEVLMEQYTELYMCKNSVSEGKKFALEDSLFFLTKSQLAPSTKLALVWDPFAPSASAPKQTQMTLVSGFQQLNQSDICSSDDFQLEMAIADFLIAKTLQTMLLKVVGFGTCWAKHNLSQVTSSHQVENKLLESTIFVSNCHWV